MAEYTKALLFYNPESGLNKSDNILEQIELHFSEHNIQISTEIVTKPRSDLQDIVNQAKEEGFDLFIAAGGDGTVSFVGNTLVDSRFPLGILPLGTGNLVAIDLGIPQKLDQALNLITSDDHNLIKMDTFSIGDRHYISNLSVGVSPQMIEFTDSTNKKRIGVFAYLISLIQQLLGLKLIRYKVEFDKKKKNLSASEILITNIKTAGVDPLKWSEDVSINDGALDMLIFRATNIFDVLGLLVSIFTNKGQLNPVLKFEKIKEYCRINSEASVQVQADGDIIGETPVEITVKPHSLIVIANGELK